MSAPHMHVTCLEALDLQPGHSFLDIGSGCGLVTATAAFLARAQPLVQDLSRVMPADSLGPVVYLLTAEAVLARVPPRSTALMQALSALAPAVAW